MFAFAGNLVSGVTNAVYSTIFGADTEPEATTELEPTQHPELTEPNTEQNIPPIEKLQININTPSQEKINSTPQPSRESRESYVPIIQPSPRNNTDATKNFDLRTKNLHAALTSPSTFNYNTPQKSAFKRTDSPSRGISSQPSKIPPHLVYASPVTRPLATYPTNYDSPKKRIYEQTPEKFGDSYKKIKFDNSPRRGPYGSYSASYNNSYNTTYNDYSDQTPLDSPRGSTKKHSRDHSNTLNLSSSARENETKKMKHEPINNQSKRTNPASQYSLSQVLSKESSAETSHYAEDDDDIRNESNVLSLSKSLSQKSSPVLSSSNKSTPKTNSSTPLDLPYDTTPSSPLVSSLISSKGGKKFSTLPKTLPKAPDSISSFKNYSEKSEPNSLFGPSSNQTESRSSASAEPETRSMSLDPVPSTKLPSKASLTPTEPRNELSDSTPKPTTNSQVEAPTPIATFGSVTPSSDAVSLGTSPQSTSPQATFGAPSEKPLQPSFGFPNSGSTQDQTATFSFGSVESNSTSQGSFNSSSVSLESSTPIVFGFQSYSPLTVTIKDAGETLVYEAEVKYNEKKGDDYLLKGKGSVRILKDEAANKFRLVIHEKDTVWNSIPITAALKFNREESRTISFDDFRLFFRDSNSCEDVFDELNDSIKAIADGTKPAATTTTPDSTAENSTKEIFQPEKPEPKQLHFGDPAFTTPIEPQPSTGFSFGAPPTTQKTEQPNLHFGTQSETAKQPASQTSGPSFGTSTQQAEKPEPKQLRFGDPAFTTPIESQPSTGFSFGTSSSTQPSAVPSFGVDATPSSNLFGNPSSVSSTPLPEPQPKSDTTSLFTIPNTTIPSFGASTSANSLFGAQSENANQTTPSFGTPSTQKVENSQPTFPFGGSTSTQPTGASPNFSFSSPMPAVSATPTPQSKPEAPLFGTPSTAAPKTDGSTQPAFGSFVVKSDAKFGTPSTPSTAPSSGASLFGSSAFNSTPNTNEGFSFGTSTSTPKADVSSQPSFGSFGAKADTPSLFGTPTTTQPKTEAPLFGTPSTAAPKTDGAAQPAFGSFVVKSDAKFGTPSTPSTASSSGFSFGTSTSTPKADTSSQPPFGSFGAKADTSSLFSAPSTPSAASSTSGTSPFGVSAFNPTPIANEGFSFGASANLSNSKSGKDQKPSQPAFSFDNNASNSNNNNNQFSTSASNLFSSQPTSTQAPSFLTGPQSGTSNSMFGSSTPAPNSAFSFGATSNSSNTTPFSTQPKSSISTSTKGKLGSKPSTPTQTPPSPFNFTGESNTPFGTGNNSKNMFSFDSSSSSGVPTSNMPESDMDMGDTNDMSTSNNSSTSTANADSSNAFSLTSSSSSTTTPSKTGQRRIFAAKKTGKK